jgi:hypothetical protein
MKTPYDCENSCVHVHCRCAHSPPRAVAIAWCGGHDLKHLMIYAYFTCPALSEFHASFYIHVAGLGTIRELSVCVYI